MADPGKTLGQVCYEAYFTDAGGMSLVTGDSLPSFDGLLPRVRQAWEAGARAVAETVAADAVTGPELR